MAEWTPEVAAKNDAAYFGERLLKLKPLLQECLGVLSFLQRDPKVMDPMSVMYDRISGLLDRAEKLGVKPE